MSEDQRMIDQKIKEMEYIIYKYEQLKKIAEGFKTCIEAIVGGDVIFRDKEGENIYYGIGRKIEVSFSGIKKGRIYTMA